MRVNDLSRLRELFTQDEAGLATHVYAQLQFGDMWWIPDEQTGFGHRDRHPWVVLEGYQVSRPTVMICPRTSQIEPVRPGLLMPAGLLDGLERPGLVLISKRQPFRIDAFRAFEHIGRLPEAWAEQLRAEYRQAMHARGRASQ